jgi:hypothetical protein
MSIKKNTQGHNYLGQMLNNQMPEIVDVPCDRRKIIKNKNT